MSRSTLANHFFLAVGAIGALYLLAETVLQFQGKTICATEGCRVASQSTRYGDLSMVLLGLAVLLLLTVLALRGARRPSAVGDRVINVLLISALAGEGFLVGYQLFHLHTACIFCMSVLAVYIILGLLRLLGGHLEVLSGFAALVVVFGLLYLILPSGGTALPLSQKYILFFSPDCKHCSEIRKEIDRQGIEVLHVDVKEHAATLKNLGIQTVPTLMVNGPYEKIFLTGTDAIRRYLSSCRNDRPLATGAAPRSSRSRTTSAPTGSAGSSGTLNFFPAIGNPGQIFNPPQDEGICREDAKCN